MTDTYEFAATTPRGIPCVFVVRVSTNDQNSVQAAVTEDEYGLADLDLGSGVALDIGAHVGSVAVALAMDNPDARIIAVEPVPANVELARHNAERNGVGDRVEVLERAAGHTGIVSIAWDYSGNETALHHRFIGNAVLGGSDHYQTVEVPGITLADLVTLAGGHVAFMKVDCEGGEYDFLSSPSIADVDTIRGEFHRGSAGMAPLLSATHAATFGPLGVDHFEAVRL